VGTAVIGSEFVTRAWHDRTGGRKAPKKADGTQWNHGRSFTTRHPNQERPYMTQQSRYGYQSNVVRDEAASVGAEVKGRAQEAADKAMEIGQEAADKAVELGQEAIDRADEWLKPVGLSIREKPVATLAVVGGLAFAAGALWMMRPQRHASQINDLVSQLSNYARKGW
jgi:ElaB/YqjD/DUF883 family membrane-anchored ribosome-binding protein